MREEHRVTGAEWERSAVREGLRVDSLTGSNSTLIDFVEPNIAPPIMRERLLFDSNIVLSESLGTCLSMLPSGEMLLTDLSIWAPTSASRSVSPA